MAYARKWLVDKQGSLVNHIRDYRGDEDVPELWMGTRNPCAAAAVAAELTLLGSAGGMPTWSRL